MFSNPGPRHSSQNANPKIAKVFAARTLVHPFSQSLIQSGWTLQRAPVADLSWLGQRFGKRLDVQYQGHFHDAFRDSLVADFRRHGAAIATEVPISLVTGGSAARCDFIGRPRNSPTAIVADVKTGRNWTFTPAQRLVYGHCTVGGLVKSDDHRLHSLGLTPATPLPPMDFMVIIAPEPNADYDVWSVRAGTPPFQLPWSLR